MAITSSRKNSEVKQLGPRLALGWVTIQGMDMDALKLLQYCKIRHGASIICFREEKNMNHNLDPDPNWAIIHDPDPTKLNIGTVFGSTILPRRWCRTDRG